MPENWLHRLKEIQREESFSVVYDKDTTVASVPELIRLGRMLSRYGYAQPLWQPEDARMVEEARAILERHGEE